MSDPVSVSPSPPHSTPTPGMNANPTGERPAALVLAMLLLVYIFNFVDRQILAILAAPIQQDLNLSDKQLGLLGGIAFALLYSTLGVPLAWLADRTGRSRVIAGSLVVWSGFTALCALAGGFWHIFLARVGVGVGEAGGVAPSYAIIGAYFPPRRRAFALSIYSLGIPIGSAAGVLAGGYIATRVDWRTAFIAVGLAGVLIAPLVRHIVRDRAGPAPAVGTAKAPRFVAVARTLAAKPSFWLLSFAAASGSMLGYGIAFWLPSLLRRSFGLGLIDTAHFIAAILLIGGTGGILGGGWLADRLGARDRAWFGYVPAIAYAVSIPFFAGGICSGDVRIAFALFLLPQALSYAWLGPVLAAIQNLVVLEARATAAALFLLINNLIGLGGGIYALGALSDTLAPIYGTDSLRYSMLYALVLYALAALLIGLAGPHLRRDWVGGVES